jgi:hypothetical protein
MHLDCISLSFSVGRGECHLAARRDRNPALEDHHPPAVGSVYPEELPARLAVLREVLRGDVERPG